MQPLNIIKDNQGLRVVAYPGDNKILLAMSLDDTAINDGDRNLAGFAISRKHAGKDEQPLLNRISFVDGVSKDTTVKTRKFTPSDQAPFQKFRWVDVPKDGFDAPITYRVRVLYFTGQEYAMQPGPEVTLEVAPARRRHTRFRPAFTRGYIASQAYADRFQNRDIRPLGAKTPVFDTTPFKEQYEWLGADAREQLFSFIADCESDADARVDVFAYDLDEPDVIAAICRMGNANPGRVRAILDDAPLHLPDKKTGEKPPEVEAARMIFAALGKANVKQGKFGRFQHNKVFIKRDAAGNGQRVIFGSMNFSVRGLYVQANNVIVVDDAKVAGMFAKAFDVAFANDVKAPAFKKDKISAGYMVGSAVDTPDLPKFSLALSPHTDSQMSLGPMMERIRHATSSVLFAVMEPKGTGPVLGSLRQIAAEPTVFSYGTVETDSGLAVQSPDGAMGVVTGFAFLAKNIPPPFTKEFSGGSGRHIHDKFVIVDFNAANPTVFTGSSNLAEGGETANGDSLAMIEDAAVANMFAIEAVALFDHFHFRKVMQTATKAEPLTLWFPGKEGQPSPWWKRYYDRTKIQMRDRLLFAGLPLPSGLAATKNVDWAALDKQAGKQPTKKRTKNSTGASKTAAKKTAAKKMTKTVAKKVAKKTAKKTAKKNAGTIAGKMAATNKQRAPRRGRPRNARRKAGRKRRR